MAELGCLASIPLRQQGSRASVSAQCTALAASTLLSVATAPQVQARGAHLLEDDALAVRRASEGVALELRAKVRLLVRLLRPPLLPAHRAQLARGVDSTRLACGAEEPRRVSLTLAPAADRRRRQKRRAPHRSPFLRSLARR